MRWIFFLIFFFKTNSFVWSNPFLIDFPVKRELTNEDYLLIQEKLRVIDLNPLLQEHYKDIQSIELQTDYGYFFNRCTRGIYQTFIDPEKGLFPFKDLVKINEGGDCCIVSTAPYAEQYAELLRNQTEALKEVGWNGYHLRFFGAFPNPTGKEIRYAGVPYSFKIFAMLEAQRLGFNKVMWMDAALEPAQDLSEAFTQIETTGSFLTFLRGQTSFDLPYLSHETWSLLKEATGTNVDDIHVYTTAFGLLMDHPLTCSFIQQYYQFCEWGYPFISGYPEEKVFSAILFQKEFADWTLEENNFTFWFPFYFHRLSHKRPNYYKFHNH